MTKRPLLIAFALASATGLGLSALADGPQSAATDAAGAPSEQHRGHEGAWQHQRGPRTIDLAELDARSKEIFDRLDSNHDGYISEAELNAGGPMGGGMAGRMGPGGMGHGRAPHGPLGHETGHDMDDGAMGPPPFMGHMGPEGKGHGEDGDRPSHAEMMAAVFKRLDANHDGKLTSEEFSHLHEAGRAEMVHRIFEHLDRNHDGKLSRDEFPPMQARLHALDVNHDGKVTPDEFPKHGHREGGEGHDGGDQH